ncbi:50S ribosomal protein L13 [Allisonella histaminiformans]|jgi:large subunit ribosomal protein L13|uniref:Large ribosomal subunit protein uL13 n=1 Tax=Allisonella histaminiformans TaxID=209880 RepID=A0A1G5WRJ1_9FIRM|nr:50S ribosomal protein L13 [Allisonella histaminiformans]PWL46891.1 MAG: 50S ribosomal protein L13 [Veillonellaceae bacterium]MCI6002905.1 50S ribosomal protein L13 [Allisonella histaminiformans]MDD6870817.1 50S ribosomal protein L13 [Allisonella histaminiformans]MDY3957288.1 50S ribosomal protein L13 [Allisonella histaminiformans]SDA60147.1 LSU ribosomal protein L13P [Allisonella histaminiformans]
MRTTFMANSGNITRKWYVVDAEGKTLGRLAAGVAEILRGKNKVTFTPHVDTGDYVIVINADKVVLTGKKEQTKVYFHYTGYVGGDRYMKAGDALQQKPVWVVEHAIRGMLPKNKLGDQMFRKLHVYAGAEHPHAAQQPEEIKFDIR